MLRVWDYWQPGGMGGSRVLPSAGGLMDQAAIMVDALRIMDQAAAQFREEQGPRGKGEE